MPSPPGQALLPEFSEISGVAQASSLLASFGRSGFVLPTMRRAPRCMFFTLVQTSRAAGGLITGIGIMYLAHSVEPVTCKPS